MMKRRKEGQSGGRRGVREVGWRGQENMVKWVFSGNQRCSDWNQLSHSAPWVLRCKLHVRHFQVRIKSCGAGLQCTAILHFLFLPFCVNVFACAGRRLGLIEIYTGREVDELGKQKKDYKRRGCIEGSKWILDGSRGWGRRGQIWQRSTLVLRQKWTN